jgi:NAD+ kinase
MNSAASTTPDRLRAVLLAADQRADVRSEVERLRPIVEKYAQLLLVDFGFSADLTPLTADLVIVVGGDGSILRAAHQMADRQWPVVGVNLGKLGFLTDLLPASLERVLIDFAAGRIRIVEHLMFDCCVVRDGTRLHQRLCLNEVAVLAGQPFAILEVQLYVDAELATTYSCDGLIVSTPVGSTAHSLSAGGPILRKDLQAVVISPISPHTLTNRPVVDAADRIYELVAPRPHEGTWLVVDGAPICSLTGSDRVRIERSAARFKLVEAAGHGYYRTLREKLGWSGQLKLNH